MSGWLFFCWVMLPIPAVLIILLLLPSPAFVRNSIVNLCDSILFVKPHPQIPLSLFWVCQLACVIIFFGCVNTYLKSYEDYKSNKNFGERPKIKLLAAERNVWLSLYATSMWFFLHRYRHLQKKYIALEKETSKDSNIKKNE